MSSSEDDDFLLDSDVDEDDELYEEDDDQEDDDDGIGMDIVEPSTSQDKHEEEFVYDVLSTDQIVEHMVNCIKEVSNIVEVRLDSLVE